MPLDADTLKVLLTVKKSQPARFLMLVKAEKVAALVAYRKGSYDAVLNRAKFGGVTGTPVLGVIEGSAATFFFKISSADHQQSPVRNQVLKEFLNTVGNQNLTTAEFQIVEVLPEVADPEAGRPTRPAPPTPADQPQGQVGTQAANQPQATTGPPQITPTPQPDAETTAETRRQMGRHAAEKVGQIVNGTNILSFARLQEIVQDCETDLNSDFGMAAREVSTARAFQDGTKATLNNVGLLKQMGAAKAAVQKYLATTARDPSPAAAKRRTYCTQFLEDLERYFKSIQDQNAYAVALCEGYTQLLKGGKEVPYKVCEELRKLSDCGVIGGSTIGVIENCCTLIENSNQAIGYAKVAKMNEATPEEKAAVLIDYGCYKRGGGGTSDVKLLLNADGTIAAAFKSMSGESPGGAAVLGLRKGCGTMREDVMSIVCQGIQKLSGFDVGFPKARVVRIDGEVGALVDGVKGGTADPEDMKSYIAQEVVEKLGQAKADEKYREAAQRIRELPDKITADSLQNVVLSSMLAAQWDAKWGNLIIDDGGTARPIDGGTAFPTKKVVTDFNDERGLGISQLLHYPLTGEHPKSGQELPQAQLPLPPDKVQAILKIDADRLVDLAKRRRDQLLLQNPELQGDMLEDDCIEVMGDSIKAVQHALQKKPDVTLWNLVRFYEAWFKKWAGERN